MTDKEKQKERIKELISGLPQENYYLLGRLMQMFKKIVDNQATTKMGSQNIAISFGMNLMRMEVDDPMKLATSTTAINKTCELLINYCEELFPEQIKLLEVEILSREESFVLQDEATPELMGWQEFFDEAHQKHYYYNPSTGETSWTHPNKMQGTDSNSGNGGDGNPTDNGSIAANSSSSSSSNNTVVSPPVSPNEDVQHLGSIVQSLPDGGTAA